MSRSEIRPLRGAGLVPAPRRADRGCVGDSQDFAAVYDRWMPQLTRYCRGLTRSEADAEDAAQNAMVKAMDALRRGPAPEQMQPWLHRIARNEAISLMRRRGTAGAAVPTDVLPDRGGPSLEEVAAVRGRLQELLGDLRALAPRQREALMLRELEGRSYREIATVLGVSEAAAQQTVLTARRSLQDCDAGRALACEPVQQWLSAHEHALVRTRRVRAHLRDCDGCRGFQAALVTRPRDLRALLPGGAGVGLLARLLGVLGGGSGAAAKAVVGAGLAATAATAGLIAVGPVPAAHGPVASPPPRAATATAPHRRGQAPTATRTLAGPRTARATSHARPASGAGGGRVAVRVPGRTVHGAGHAPAARPVAPASGRPQSVPAATTSGPADAHGHASSAHAVPDPAPAVGPASSSAPVASVPATPVSPSVTLSLPDPAPVVQAASATTTAVQAAVASATTAVAPVVESATHTLDAVLGHAAG